MHNEAMGMNNLLLNYKVNNSILFLKRHCLVQEVI